MAESEGGRKQRRLRSKPLSNNKRPTHENLLLPH
jgi:hypothetical protein